PSARPDDEKRSSNSGRPQAAEALHRLQPGLQFEARGTRHLFRIRARPVVAYDCRGPNAPNEVGSVRIRRGTRPLSSLFSGARPGWLVRAFPRVYAVG